MPEEGNWIGNIKKRLGFGERKPASPEKKELTPEQKAQQALYQANMQSLTDDRLQSIAEFNPPNATFDISKLGDGAIFRVLNDTILIYNGKEDQYLNHWTYGCIVYGADTIPRLYVTEFPPEVSSDDQLMMPWLSIVEDFEKHGPDSISVQETPFSKPDLDWNEPLDTLPPDFFIRNTVAPLSHEDRDYAKHTVDVNVYKIELVSGGKQVKQKTPQTSENRQPGFNHGLAPNPQMS